MNRPRNGKSLSPLTALHYMGFASSTQLGRDKRLGIKRCEDLSRRVKAVDAIHFTAICSVKHCVPSKSRPERSPFPEDEGGMQERISPATQVSGQ